MERAFYFWTGAILAGFWGFFAVWTYGSHDPDGSRTNMFWLSVGGTIVGVVLLLVAVIATAVGIALRERASE
ncbi:hypothetical protein [Nocardioides pyridinolyticus]